MINGKAALARVMTTGHADRVRVVLEERAELIARGDVTLAGDRARVVEDMVGHWQDGEFVGAQQIADAMGVR